MFMYSLQLRLPALSPPKKNQQFCANITTGPNESSGARPCALPWLRQWMEGFLVQILLTLMMPVTSLTLLSRNYFNTYIDFCVNILLKRVNGH